MQDLAQLEEALYNALIAMIEAEEDETGPVSFSMLVEETPDAAPLIEVEWLYETADDVAEAETTGAQLALRTKTTNVIQTVVGDKPYVVDINFAVDDEEDDDEMEEA